MTARERIKAIQEIMQIHLLTDTEKLDRIVIVSKANGKLKKYSIKQIEEAVIHHFKIVGGDLQTKTRNGEIVLARQVAHYLAKEHTNESLTAIGAYFGGKKHSTVNNSCWRIEGYLAKDRHFNARHRDFINEFKN